MVQGGFDSHSGREALWPTAKQGEIMTKFIADGMTISGEVLEYRTMAGGRLAALVQTSSGRIWLPLAGALVEVA